VINQYTANLIIDLKLTQEDINSYARASGDFNPIHVDEDFARQTPYGGTIAHGLLLVGTLSQLFLNHIGFEWCLKGALKIRFKKPAKPGDTLTLTASRRDNAPNKEASVYDVSCINQNSEIILEGQARVG
jgi:acyl dehydratase